MSSKQNIESALQQAKKQLLAQFMALLFGGLVVILLLIGIVFFFDSYKEEKKYLHSLSTEYQRILTYESDKKLIHVIESNQQRLFENHISVYLSDKSGVLSYFAGDEFPVMGLDKAIMDWGDQGFFYFLSQPHLAIQLQGKVHVFRLVVDLDSRYASAFKNWLITCLSVVLLALITAVLVHRLLSKTLLPLSHLAEDIQRLDEGNLNEISQTQVSQASDGFALLYSSVHNMLGKLTTCITTLDRTLDAIAHDLRTPLTRIHLTAEKALSLPAQNHSPEHLSKANADLTQALSDCAENSTQANNLLTALMKLNDELTGKKPTRLQKIDPNVMMSRVAGWYEDIAEVNGIHLNLELADSHFVEADAYKLTQIIVNVLDNALKYTPEGGSVTLSTSVHQGDYQIAIKDTGIGIDPEYHELIFKRLFRVDESRNLTPGYGLGLSLTKAMVDSINGSISVESTLGQGSCFKVGLKRVKA
ncbi:putative Two component sensor histidine kinase [Vibrio nigripulchritudo MADA3029]|uniref:sensor histidine kinase n=1 Tax=Vibrio nigripulchritudo TaxID=28173 RepID=UPI0003B1BA54|nr:HAMP domain-containing sensor histidine kinase [Vibrio nigripulchritudo]CCN47416.1 putative Two component sensor histidine kinase [Vibrio nigripulchritudo MADA3020]CCN55017.1 putative Two component sensor histidine kinase [Vibrio nigripulchritudo MADA3021]CCN56804.1 putative Two component sensor histidine kinase [Vibrio nigripulchritudo MADA3029]